MEITLGDKVKLIKMLSFASPCFRITSMFLLARDTCNWEQPRLWSTYACNILGPKLSIFINLTLSPKVISLLFLYSVLVGITKKDVAHLFVNSEKWDRNSQKPIFIKYSNFYNNKELEDMFT